MNAKQLLAHFERMSDAPDAVTQLRQFVLDLAMRGRLTNQEPTDEPARKLLNAIGERKRRLGVGRSTGRGSVTGDADVGLRHLHLPAGWVTTTLGEIAEKITDGAHKTPTYIESGVPFVSVKDFSGGQLDLSSTRFISAEEHAALYKRCDPRRGDILIGRIGTLGKAVLVETGVQFSLFVSVGLIRFAHDYTAPRFLRMLLNSPLVAAEFDRIKVGGGTHTNKLNLGDLHTIVLPLPPLAEQHRIVAKVDELMKLCDDLEAAQKEREERRNRLAAASLARLNQPADDVSEFREHARFHLRHLPRLVTKPEHVKQLRQTIFNLAVRGKLVKQHPEDEPAERLLVRILAERVALKLGVSTLQKALTPVDGSTTPFTAPAGWIWTRFGEIIMESDAGWSPKTEGFPREGDAFGVLKVSAVSWDRFLPEQNKQLLPGAVPPPAALVRPGDFLISRANTSELVAKCVVVDGEHRNLVLSDKIVRLRLSELVEKGFLWIVNNYADYARSYYAREASGTSLSMKNVSRLAIYSLPIPCPPREEQRRIVAKVDELMAVCDQLDAQLAAREAGSQRLLEAVLHEALADAA